MATKAAILPVPGREQQLADLRTMILDGGCEVVCETGDLIDCLKSTADVLVVLVCPDTIGSAAVTPAAEAASDHGKRVVGVWSKDAEAGKLPEALHRIGSAIVPMDAAKVAEAVCGCKDVWLMPDGGTRATPPTPRHKG